MARSLAFVIAAVILAPSAHAAGNAPLIGAWHLVAVEQPAPDGSMQKIECPGLLTFTTDGHMALQLMQPEGTANAYSHGGYEATFGTFRMGGKGQFTYHVTGSLVRDLVGKDLPRRFRITGKTLEIRSAHTDEHWRVIWARD